MSSILREDQYFNNESNFCRVSGAKAKAALEKILLANGISYFVKWDDRSWLSRLLEGGRNEHGVCTIRINTGDIARATELVKGMEGITVIGREPQHDWSPKEQKLREQRAIEGMEAREREEAEQQEDPQREDGSVGDGDDGGRDGGRDGDRAGGRSDSAGRHSGNAGSHSGGAERQSEKPRKNRRR
jgi:hypothetical protein